ncbi:hypothetical protein TNCV_595581 [Trichonephila clavipes]|nr:hypothetical protein TNCV_595581 [Trichonephila clavipes]
MVLSKLDHIHTVYSVEVCFSSASIDRIEYTTSVQEGWFIPLAKCLEKEIMQLSIFRGWNVNVHGIDIYIKGIMSDLKKRNHEEKYRNT